MKPRRRHFKRLLGVALAGLLAAAFNCRADLVNGSFENPAGVYPYRVFDIGNPPPGWTVESGTVEIVGTYWPAAQGSQSLDLNGIFEYIGTIYQDVPTVPGERYKIRFAYAGNPEGGPVIKTTKVFWDGAELATVSFDTTGRSRSNMGWVYYDYEVTATSGTGRLRFQSMTSSFCGPALDDVSVTPVNPLPPPPPPPLPSVPAITSFSPASGPVGAAVAIAGRNFGATARSNIVYFGATQATVTEASPDSLAVMVPIGATYAPISVTVGGLTAYSSTPFVPTFAGSRGLTAESFAPRVTFPTGHDSGGMVIGDLDGDGKPDVALMNYQSSTLSVFRNTSATGRISEGLFAPRVDFPAGPNPAAVALGDLDGDGRLDIVVANDYGANISVYRNTSAPGSFHSRSLAPRVNFAAGTHPVSVAIADFDGDGRADIAVVNAVHGPSTVGIYRNTGGPGGITASSFAPPVEFAAGDYAFKVAVGDLDGDGRPDLAVANIETANVSVLRNTSGAGGSPPVSFAPKMDLPTGGRMFDVKIGDLDGDGRGDIAATGDYALSVFHNVSASASATDRSLAFAPRLSWSTGGTAYEIALGDLDGDTKPDLALTVLNQAGVSVFRNNSSPGTFSPRSLGPKTDFAGAGNSVAIGDLDGDGRPELLTCLSFTLSVYRNVAPAPQPPHITGQPESIAVVLGGTANFTVAAAGDPPLSFQWRHNGAAIDGATSPTLNLRNAQPSHAGDYAVEVSNSLGTAISTSAVLTVLPLEEFLTQAIAQLVNTVNSASRPRNPQPLLVSLEAARRSFARGNLRAGIAQMQVFQNQVRAQVAPADPALAAVLTSRAQRIIDAAQAAAPPAPADEGTQTDQRITCLPDGKMCVIIQGPPGSVYLIEGSENLRDWEAVGIAEEREPGRFQYEEATASPRRYYRSVPR